jgi:hypothetical protein
LPITASLLIRRTPSPFRATVTTPRILDAQVVPSASEAALRKMAGLLQLRYLEAGLLTDTRAVDEARLSGDGAGLAAAVGSAWTPHATVYVSRPPHATLGCATWSRNPCAILKNVPHLGHYWARRCLYWVVASGCSCARVMGLLLCRMKLSKMKPVKGKRNNLKIAPHLYSDHVDCWFGAVHVGA